MKVACILITHLRAKAEMQRRPHLKDRPVLIADRTRSRPVVVDHFPAFKASTGHADALCWQPEPVAGMPLERALSYQAEAVVLDADESHYRRVFRQVLTALQGISDRVEDAGPGLNSLTLGVAYVALDGLESMYGGEERLVLALLNAVPRHLDPRAGIGEGKFPALVAARSSGQARARKIPPDAAAFLAPRPIALLPVSENTISALHRFGLHTLGQVAAMDVDRLVDQFGREGQWLWELANGRDDRPLVPLEYEETVTEETSLPFSSTSLEMLLVASDTLLRRAYARPVMRGRYAGRASLECPVFGSAPWERTMNFQESVGRWERAAFIVRSRLEAEPPEVPVDGLALTLSNFTGESGAQIGLLPDVREDRRGRILEAERRLQTRQAFVGRGGSRALRENGDASRPARGTLPLPRENGDASKGQDSGPFPTATTEREHASWWPCTAEGDKTGGPVKRPALYRVVEVAPWHPAPEMRAVQTPLDPLGGELRPLLSPEPVMVREDRNGLPEAIRSESPFRGRKGRQGIGAKKDHWRQVARIEDCWTFDLWWLPKPLTRTYYRVERENGGQVTLFRDQHDGCWYQQGH